MTPREAEQLAALAQLDRLLAGHGLEYWLFGGWAVDFHAGSLTRPHEDLDVAIWRDDHARIAELLAAAGWSHAPDRGEDGSTVYERGGVRLELAFLARDEDGDVYTPLVDGRAGWAAGAFGHEVAELDGVRARVIGRRALEAEKSQPQADPVAAAKDRADVATLARADPAPAAKPTLFYDLGSPYAFLAVERAPLVLGVEPDLQPILLGAIFALRGRGSWSQTASRYENVAEVERRAREYGLPPLRWPPGWPSNTLRAMRAAIWAKDLGAGGDFARVAFHHAFVAGLDLSDPRVLSAVAQDAELDADVMLEAIESPAIKAQLRAATDDAWARGVTGVPTLLVGDEPFYGDDRLEEAAAALSPAARSAGRTRPERGC